MRRMLRGITLLFVSSVGISTNLVAQQKWDGGGGDGQWTNPLNWANDLVPGPTDTVVLDHSFVPTNYTVTLPSGNASVTLQLLRIAASSSTKIQLQIPVSNVAVPALSLSGAPGLNLLEGAVFVNSSGAASGTVLNLADSICIYSGARFIQNSRTAHATYISKLSRAPGTERGVFEFNVPGTASYTVSLAGRTYGDLELNASAAGGSKTYLSNGTNPATIKGSLTILTGTVFTLDFAADLQVGNDLVVNGSLNVSSASASNRLNLGGNLINSGSITESGTGNPFIRFAGTTIQSVWQTGIISNQVGVSINNTNTVILRTLFQVPHLLNLVSGKLKSSDTSLLVMGVGGAIVADSNQVSCFVDGPMKILGLSSQTHFLCPIGKGNTQRWLALKDATGDFEVEFFKQSARSIGTTIGPGLDHVSSIEYWKIKSSPAANTKIELSFNDVNSGGVSDMNTLRAAIFRSGVWENAGNTAFTGSAGAAGSVISNQLNNLEPIGSFFSLASSSGSTNPLPFNNIESGLKYSNERVLLHWTIRSEVKPVKTQILYSKDGVHFTSVNWIETTNTDQQYSFLLTDSMLSKGFFQLRVQLADGYVITSRQIMLPGIEPTVNGIRRLIVSGKNVQILLSSNRTSRIELLVYSVEGRLFKKIPMLLQKGEEEKQIQMGFAPAGLYVLVIKNEGRTSKPYKFILQ